jgi:hypothetical protein
MWLPPADDDAAWLAFLAREHDRIKPKLQALDDEYEGRTAIHYMQPEVERELGERLTQVVLAWPQLVVDAVEERLDVEGFGLPDSDGGDDDLWRVWQANDLDDESSQGHVDALALSRAYACVGSGNDEATPVVTLESALEVHAVTDPRTRDVVGAVRRWYQNPWDQAAQRADYATLYLPDRTVYWEGGKIVDRDEHRLGVVPVVPLVNRARLADRRGRSELDPVLPLSRAANKILTDMMVAAEFVALPLRGIFGVGPDDFKDQEGNTLTALQAIMGKMLAIPGVTPADVREFEFKSADLGNFERVVKLLAALVGSLAGLPPHMVGLATDNPASADAIRSAEARLIKRAERRQRILGASWERTMKIVRRLQSGDWDPAMSRLETLWRDAATPTIAQKADATVKLHAEGIITTRQARLDLGYTDPQIRRMEAEEAEQGDRLLGVKPGPRPPTLPMDPPQPEPVPA